MKIKLLKDHLDNTAGDTIEVKQQRGGYLVRVGVAEETKAKSETKELKQEYHNKKRNPKS